MGDLTFQVDKVVATVIEAAEKGQTWDEDQMLADGPQDMSVSTFSTLMHS